MKPLKHTPLPGSRDVAAAAEYAATLHESHGRYARSVGETRRLVDDSMGATSLTELLYKSREDGTSDQMAIFYLDTSAILKRYRTEKGTDVVDELYDGRSPRDLLLTSHFSCLEFESVAARALKGSLLNQGAYDAMLGSFSSDLGKYVRLLEISGAGLNGAIAFSRKYALRAADAIQAASAADVVASPPRGDAVFVGGVGIVVPGGRLVFVSSDRELLTATNAAGMTTLDPESEDAMEELRELRT